MSVYSVGVCDFDKKDCKYYDDLLIKDIVRVQGFNHVVIKIGLASDEVSLFYNTDDNLLNSSPTKLITKTIRPMIDPTLPAPTSANLVDFLKKINEGYIPVCVLLKFNADDTCVVNKFAAIGYLDNYNSNNFMKMADAATVAEPIEKDFANFAEIYPKDVAGFTVVVPNTSVGSAMSKVASSAGNIIKSSASSAYGGMSNIASSAGNVIKSGASSAYGGMLNVASSAGNYMKNTLTRKSKSTTKLCEFVNKVIESKKVTNPTTPGKKSSLMSSLPSFSMPSLPSLPPLPSLPSSSSSPPFNKKISPEPGNPMPAIKPTSEYEQKISVMREQFDNASKMQIQTNAFMKKGKNSVGIELEYIVKEKLIDDLFDQISGEMRVTADMDRLTEIVCDDDGITRYTENLHLILTGKKPDYSKSRLCEYMKGDEKHQDELEKMKMTMLILPDADITEDNYELIKKGDKVKGPDNIKYTIKERNDKELLTDVKPNGNQIPVTLTSPTIPTNGPNNVSTKGFTFVSSGIIENAIVDCINTYNYIVTKIVVGIKREIGRKPKSVVAAPDPKSEVVAAAPEPKSEVDEAITLEKCLNNKIFGKPENCKKVEKPFLTKDEIEQLNDCEKLFEYAETMHLIITGKKTGCNKNSLCQKGDATELEKLIKTKFLDHDDTHNKLDNTNHNLLKVGDQISIDAGGVLCDIKKIDNKTIKIIDKNGNKYEYNLTTGNITNREVDFTDKKPTGGRLINSEGNHDAFFIKSGNINSENAKNLDTKFKFKIQTCIDTYNLVVDQIKVKYDGSKLLTSIENPLSMPKSNKVGIVKGGGLKRNFAVQTAIPRIYRQVIEVHKTAGSVGPYERRTDYYNYA